jgi:selenocysteine lyase/cysteine desulfurase
MSASSPADPLPKFLPDALLDGIRSRFLHVDTCPITKKPRVFLESGGGSLKLKTAIEASAHLAGIPDQEARDNDASRYVTAAITKGREDLRLFVGAADGQVISGESGTMLLWRIIRDVAMTQGPGPFLSSTLEHPASHDPAGYWAERTGRARTDIHLDIKGGTVTAADYAKAVTPDTRLATIIHTSQLTGLHVDLHAIVRAIRAVAPDCFVIVDGIQNAPHGRVEVDTYGADAYVFSAYKVFSRLSHGFAWLSPRLVAIPHERPHGKKDYVWEKGSRDPGIYASHSAVVDYFEWVGGHFTGSADRRTRVLAAADAMAAHEKALVGLLINGDAHVKGLLAHPGVTLVGPPDLANRQGIVSFGLKGFTAPELVQQFAAHDIRVHARVDDEYSGHILADLGMKDCLRVSLCHYNSPAEIRAALTALYAISPG